MNADQKQKLFYYFQQEHKIMLLDVDFNEIDNILSSQTGEEVIKEIFKEARQLRGPMMAEFNREQIQLIIKGLKAKYPSLMKMHEDMEEYLLKLDQPEFRKEEK